MTIQNHLALRRKEAAKMLSISERTLWILTKEGRIPYVKLRRGKTSAVLYPIAELEKFLSQMLVETKVNNRCESTEVKECRR